MKRITSCGNATIKAVKSLKTKKGRDFLGCYLIEGEKVVSEAVSYQADIVTVVYSEDYNYSENSGRLVYLEDSGIELIETDVRTFSLISDTETPQGVLAVVRKPEFKIVSENWLILDRIQDPGNLGTIIRTANAAGFGTVIAIKGGSDIYAPKVVRASAGAFFHIRSTVLGDAETAAGFAGKHGKMLVAADARSGISCFDADLKRPFALAVGNEAEGLDPLLVDNADLRVNIPMQSNAESLNVSVAASVIMYEAVRQALCEGE